MSLDISIILLEAAWKGTKTCDLRDRKNNSNLQSQKEKKTPYSTGMIQNLLLRFRKNSSFLDKG